MRTLTLTMCLASLTFAGCGGGAVTGTGAGSPTAKDALGDLAELLKGVAVQKGRPPAREADLSQYEAINLSATMAIARNEVIYVWGSGIVSGSQAVIAHEKDAATAGGYVLLQDGTVKSMTAAEFAAAPKAAKK